MKRSEIVANAPEGCAIEIAAIVYKARTFVVRIEVFPGVASVALIGDAQRLSG